MYRQKFHLSLLTRSRAPCLLLCSSSAIRSLSLAPGFPWSCCYGVPSWIRRDGPTLDTSRLSLWTTSWQRSTRPWNRRTMFIHIFSKLNLLPGPYLKWLLSSTFSFCTASCWVLFRSSSLETVSDVSKRRRNSAESLLSASRAKSEAFKPMSF